MTSVSSKSAARIRYGIRAVLSGFNTGKLSSEQIGFSDLYSMFREKGTESDAGYKQIRAAQAIWKTGAAPETAGIPAYSSSSQAVSDGIVAETVFLNSANRCVRIALSQEFKGRLNAGDSELMEQIGQTLEYLDALQVSAAVRKELFDNFRTSVTEVALDNEDLQDIFTRSVQNHNLQYIDKILKRLEIQTSPNQTLEEIHPDGQHLASPSP